MTATLKKGQENPIARKTGAALGKIGSAVGKAIFWPTSAVSYAIPPFRRLAGQREYSAGIHVLCVIGTLAGIGITSAQEGIRVNYALDNRMSDVFAQDVTSSTAPGTLFPLSPVARSNISYERFAYGKYDRDTAVYGGQEVFDDRVDGKGLVICREMGAVPAGSALTYDNSEENYSQCRAVSSLNADWSSGVPVSTPSASFGNPEHYADSGNPIEQAIKTAFLNQVTDTTAPGTVFQLGAINGQGPYRMVYQGASQIDDRIDGLNVTTCRMAYAVALGQGLDPANAAASVTQCRESGRPTTPWADGVRVDKPTFSF